MKRWVFRIVLFLLLGAIINIAVAWGIAFGTSFDGYSMTGTRDAGAFAWPGYIQQLNWPHPTTIEDCEVPGLTLGVTLFEVSGGDSDAGWRSTDSPDRVNVTLIVYQFGLPVRAMQLETHGALAGPRSMELVQAAHRASGWRSGIEVSGSSAGGWKFLPVTPIWPGFAVNTVHFAGILWLLFAAPFALRRRRRLKRGLCPKCAYPIGVSDTCTECGRPVKRKLVAQKAGAA